MAVKEKKGTYTLDPATAYAGMAQKGFTDESAREVAGKVGTDTTTYRVLNDSSSPVIDYSVPTVGAYTVNGVTFNASSAPTLKYGKAYEGKDYYSSASEMSAYYDDYANKVSTGVMGDSLVSSAQQSYNDAINKALGGTQYDEQYNDLLSQSTNREAFSYDMSKDTLFQNALSSAMSSGKTAMQDTMGQASALTGGYGSSYATSVGAQAYNQYIQEAYNNLPEYYQLALQQYELEGSELERKLNAIASARNTEKNEQYNAVNITGNALNTYKDMYYSDLNNLGNLVNTDMTFADNKWTNETAEAWNEWNSKNSILNQKNADKLSVWQENNTNTYRNASLDLEAQKFNASAKQSADETNAKNKLSSIEAQVKASNEDTSSGTSTYTTSQKESIMKGAYEYVDKILSKIPNADITKVVDDYLTKNHAGILNDPYYDDVMDAVVEYYKVNPSNNYKMTKQNIQDKYFSVYD